MFTFIARYLLVCIEYRLLHAWPTISSCWLLWQYSY